MTRALPLAVPAALAALLLAGCGGSSSNSGFPTIQAARVYSLQDFTPGDAAARGQAGEGLVRDPAAERRAAHALQARPGPAHGHPPDHRPGRPLDDHPPPPADREGRDRERRPSSSRRPGLYRAVIDVYPANGAAELPALPHAPRRRLVPPEAAPAARARSVDVGGYRFTLDGASNLKAVQAQDVVVHVTGPGGKPARFTPWFGALAHAIFFRRGSLDYFHTHVCAPGATGCTSILGGAKVTGTSTKPGTLRVGVLVPAPGMWRLFLQTRVDGRVVTAPFTLKVG